MRGAIPPFPQYAFMAWCLVEVQGQLYLYLSLLKFLASYSGGLFVFLASFSYVPLFY
jgi:hypothetical protein